MNLKNEKVLITGGAGFLGRNVIKQLYENNEITVYSRDEAKHYYLGKQFPKVNFVVGDIRNHDLLNRAARNHTIGIFAASLKQIEACEKNPSEATQVIINGALNSRRVAEDNEFKAACFISSDKSRAATTVYGAMKYVAGESFILNSRNWKTNFSSAIYGNVLNSTGSIIPLMWNSIKLDVELPLYSDKMTRFFLTVDDAIGLIDVALTLDGVNVIPQAKSAKILDLFQIFHERFGLKYRLETPRAGEKIHEIMASNEELSRMKFLQKEGVYIMHPKEQYEIISFPSGEFSSKDVCLSRKELEELLENHDFFRQ